MKASRRSSRLIPTLTLPLSPVLLLYLLCPAAGRAAESDELKAFKKQNHIGEIQPGANDVSQLTLLIQNEKPGEPCKAKLGEPGCKVCDYETAKKTTERQFEQIYNGFKCRHYKVYRRPEYRQYHAEYYYWEEGYACPDCRKRQTVRAAEMECWRSLWGEGDRWRDESHVPLVTDPTIAKVAFGGNSVLITPLKEGTTTITLFAQPPIARAATALVGTSVIPKSWQRRVIEVQVIPYTEGSPAPAGAKPESREAAGPAPATGKGAKLPETPAVTTEVEHSGTKGAEPQEGKAGKEGKEGGERVATASAGVLGLVSPAVVSVKAFGEDKVSVGTGFVARADGLIVTSRHLVEGATNILVRFKDGKKPVRARVVKKHPAADLAILSLEKQPDGQIPFLKTGDTEALSAGDRVVAFRNLKGEEDSLSNGTVKSIQKMGATHYIHTTVSVAPEAVGGPLINAKGEVIGVVSSSPDDGAAPEGKEKALSSAISISDVSDMLALME